jgi:CBS-domain-containing membrane protein
VRLLVLFLGLALAYPAAAQHPAPKKAKKQQQAAHKKPTPEQIRRFKELEKKQKKD